MPTSPRSRRFVKLRLEPIEDRINPAPVPVLNSYAAAPADIFMDFDGDTGSGTTAYDTDGNAADFSASEVAAITEAWRELSIYFSMFNVNVTTVFTSARPKAWLCLGNNISGGYSYVNVFPNSEAESFNQSSDARSRVSGLAHEVGHNFGNSHQSDFNNLGVETADYISAKEPLRGYLMGVDYSGTVKKWSIGHTSNASGLQDDLLTIASDLDNYGGDGYRPDAVGGTVATATALTVNGSVQSAKGIIERYADLDYFSFTSTGGRVAITVAPEVPSGLDAILEIRDDTNTLIAVADTVANGQTITMTLPAGTFYAVVGSKGNYADLGTYDLTVKEGAPEGYQTTNVGLMWHTGSTKYDSANGTWTVSGSGADIWGTADQFQFAWQYLNGDGVITARVTGIQNTNANAKAGVMIRESLAAGSRHVSTFMQYNAAPQMVYRTSTNGSAAAASSGSAGFTPTWVRLTRVGNLITSQRSSNGTTWNQIGTQTVAFGTTCYIGLAVTSHEDEETNTTDDINDATFTNVTTTGFTNPLAITNAALAAPANPVLTRGTGNGLNVAWDAVTGAVSYSVERSNDNVSFIPVGTTTNLTYADTNPLGSQRYWYRVRAVDAVGRSDVSTTVNIVNRPSAIKNLEFTSYTNTSIVLDWFDTDGETGFKIERSADGGTNWTTLTSTLGKNVPSYTATGLTAATSYTFRVTPTSSLGDGTPTTIGGSSRLPAVSTVALGAITTTSIVLTWTDIAGETGYRIDRSTNGTTWASAGTVAAGVTTFTNTGLTASSEYYYRVVGTVSGTESAAGNTVMAGTLPATAIPAPWLSADIGTVAAQKGSSSLTGSTFKVISGGVDIWGNSDAFRFTYQPLTGNGVITARVASVEDTGGWAKIGVMIRESLNANSRHAHTFVTPGNGVNTQSRTSTGGSSGSNFQLTGVVAPQWVRMKRVGNVLSGFYSADGVTWTAAGTVTLSNLTATVYIGLSANSTSSSNLNSSTFDNVTVFRNGVSGIVIDDGTAQRSAVRTLTVTFNGLVTLPANPVNAFQVTRTGGPNPAFTVDLTGSTATRTIAKLTFTGGTVSDGNYNLTVLANQVTDASGFALGTMNVNVTQSFHRLFGDTDGSRTIDGTDLTAFGNLFNTNASAYDFNKDGIIDGTDLIHFGNNFGVTV